MISFSLTPADAGFEIDDKFFVVCATVTGLSLLLIYILKAILTVRLFRKAGIADWKAWVPFYNWWKFFQIGGYSGASALLLPIVILSIAVMALLTHGGHGWSEEKQTAACTLFAVAILAAALFVAKCLMAAWSITKKLGKSGVYMILLFINLGPPLWLWILALDKSEWNDKLGKRSIAPDMKKKSAVKAKTGSKKKK